MSIRDGIKEKLHKRRRLDSEIATYLIEDSHCLDGDSQKDEAYRIAIEYFTEKQKKSKATADASYNNIGAIKLQVLIDCYEEEKEALKKEEYARKIARRVLQTGKNWLQLIPHEIQEIAFQITIQYLEEQKSS